MTVLVTGSSGHLGEAVMRLLARAGRPARGLDRRPGPFTHVLADIAEAAAVAPAMADVAAVVHTATLHKPHVATHSRQAFVDTNVTGTLTLLEAARAAGLGRFVFTSTTSAYGSALRPGPGDPAAWIAGPEAGAPRNIYGVTKTAAEDLCRLFHRRFGIAVVILRTARFFPEPDDDPAVRAAHADENAKANEMLHRRVDLEDAATAHLAALAAAGRLGFARHVISATTPFRPEDAGALRHDPGAVLDRRVPGWRAVYARRGFRAPAAIDRVYDNAAARRDLGWHPAWDFTGVLSRLDAGAPVGSDLARTVGIKGYHGADYADGLYPIEAGDDPAAPADR